MSPVAVEEWFGLITKDKATNANYVYRRMVFALTSIGKATNANYVYRRVVFCPTSIGKSTNMSTMVV
jgi:hypothetical protein